MTSRTGMRDMSKVTYIEMYRRRAPNFISQKQSTKLQVFISDLFDIQVTRGIGPQE